MTNAGHPSEEESWLTVPDGLGLAWGCWPVERPAAWIAIIHGYAEHAGRYGLTAADFNARGWGVAGLDLRGHGRSGGARGHVRRFEDYRSDLDAWLAALGARIDSEPLFVLGHSFGGLVAADYAWRRSPPWRGLILSSPFFGVARPVPPWKRALGRLASIVLPSLAFASGIRPEELSHDPEVGRAYAADPLVFRTATAGWFFETSRAIAAAFDAAAELRLPTLILSAAEDRVADPSRARDFFERLGSPDKEFISFPEMYHEILNETGRRGVIERISRWIERRL